MGARRRSRTARKAQATGPGSRDVCGTAGDGCCGVATEEEEEEEEEE